MKFLKSIIFIIGAFSVPSYATNYAVSKLTHVHTTADGSISIKWAGSPSPGPCGSPNYGWVKIESSADNALKSFVYTLYVSGKAATVITSGCSGNYEIVTSIYSPGG